MHPSRIALAAVIVFSLSSAWAREDKWVESRSRNFVVVSNGSAQQARNTAIQFEQIRALFQQSFQFAKDQPTPVITILAAKDENTLKSLLPEYWVTKGRAHPAGIFLNYLYQAQVAVQLTSEGDNPYEAIYHEYYHSLSIPYFPGLPVWIAEGLADFYGNSKVVDKTAYLGMPNPGLIELLHEQQLIPLPVLFRVDHSSAYYNESSKVSIFYAESWALIHYLMMADHDAHRPQLMAYLDALSHGESQDAAASKAFGDLGKLQKALQMYVGNTNFYEMREPAPPKISESEVTVRPLSDAEASAYRGGFLALHQQFDAAAPLLQEAARSDPKLALTQQNMAVLYYQQKKFADAIAALDLAVELDPHNALTHYLRADLVSKGADPELHASQTDADLRAAIAADSNFAPAYAMLASRMAKNGDNLPEGFGFAKKSVELEPGVAYYQLVLAEVLARARQYDKAQEVASRMEANSLDPNDKTNAERFLEYLQNLRIADARRGEFRSVPPPADTRMQTKSASPSDSSETDSADDEEEPEAPAEDGLSRVTGTVTDVQCKVQDMVITLSTQDGTVKLHSVDNRKVDYISDVPVKSEVFWPCTALKGRIVKVKYLSPSSNQKQLYLGEISGVEIRK
jgi:tetratricopeptide (TPR) repeat protein